jgi:adenosylhomocysteine nucleosidase
MQSSPVAIPSTELAVVFALAIEAGCFVDRLSQVRVTRGDGFLVRQGQLNHHEVVLVESGAGGGRAIKAAHAIIDAYRPRMVVSAGFAGGLDTQVRRQDLVVATSLVSVGENEITLNPARFMPLFDQVHDLHLGRLLTVDHVVRLREEKQLLGRKYNALAVDMESLAVAEVCRQRAIEFFAVRAISDAMEDELPPDVGKLLAQKSFAGQLGAALGSIFRRPAAVKDLFNLHQNALASSNRLAAFLGTLVERLA